MYYQLKLDSMHLQEISESGDSTRNGLNEVVKILMATTPYNRSVFKCHSCDLYGISHRSREAGVMLWLHT